MEDRRLAVHWAMGALDALAETIGNGISEDAKLTELLARLDRLLPDHGLAVERPPDNTSAESNRPPRELDVQSGSTRS
jgi:hypothetical protein